MTEEKQKKKGGFLKWTGLGCGGLIILIILIVGCTAIFAGGGEENKDESETESSEENTEESTEEENKTAGIGETLTVDDIDFTVNEWYQQDSVGDVAPSTASDTYLILDVTVTNNQDEALMMSNDYFKIVIGETEYEPDLTASTTANQVSSPDNLGLLGEELNPGSTRDALIVYDVTQEVVDDPEKQLQVQSGVFGTETGLINLN